MTLSNERKAQTLGMSHGAACNQLRKAILFRLITRLGENTCFQCSGEIGSVDHLSIEHKVPWQGKPNGRDLFFDLANIAFSHLSCNVAERRTDDPNRLAEWNKVNTKKVGEPGTSWCAGCRDFHPVAAFGLNASKSGRDGLQQSCSAYRSRTRSKKFFEMSSSPKG